MSNFAVSEQFLAAHVTLADIFYFLYTVCVTHRF